MSLAVADLRISFGERTLFDGLSFEIAAGTLCALAGPSGSGKSTLLATIGGQQRPSAGTVRFAGVPVEPQSVDWIVQSSPLLTGRTTFDNVVLGARARDVGRTTAAHRARTTLAALGVGELAGVKVSRLSGGERQRVAVARSIVAAAPLVLADEPTASLDASNRERIMDALRHAGNQGAVVLIATHDQAVVARCDQLVDLQATDAAP